MEKNIDILNTMWTNGRKKQEHYSVPDWAEGLKVKPTSRVKLANTPTPIHHWAVPGLPEGISVFIKRDDMNGSTLGGNKVRKLEFLLSDAMDKGYRDVITIGNYQSNHVRTTMLAAKELGLEGHFISRFVDPQVTSNFGDGNTFFTRMSGCNAYFCTESDYYALGRLELMDQAVQHIRQTTGRDCYRISIGGSDVLGMYGYLDVYRELLEQGIGDHVTDIVVATTTGGTLAGLAIANYIVNRDKIRVHGYAPGLQESHDHINECLKAVGLTGVSSEDITQVTDCRGLRYPLNTPEELEFIKKVCEETGVMLDTRYTGKAAYRMLHDLNTHPEKFKGKEILFIHTGGININLTQQKVAEFQNLTFNTSETSDRRQEWLIWSPKKRNL